MDTGMKFFVVICLSIAGSAKAAIMLSGPLDHPFPISQSAGIGGLPVDFNGDGISELELYSNGSDLWIEARDSTRILAIPAVFPNQGSRLQKLPVARYVDQNFASIENNAVWLTPSETFTPTPGFPVHPSLLMRSTMLVCRISGNNMVSCLGQWQEAGTGFIGVEFSTGEQVNYAWVRVYQPLERVATAYLVDYAYESIPGKGITTGAIPEPSSLALVSLSVSVLLFVLRRRL